MQQPPRKLSDIIRRSTSRRAFLGQASVLGVGAALAACVKGERSGSETAAGADTPAAPTDGLHGTPTQGIPHNQDSKLDTTLRHGSHPLSGTPGAIANADKVLFKRYDPTLPPVSRERTVRIHMTTSETPVRIRPDLVVAAWTFDGDIPGPIVHVRQGDTVEFTLTNEGAVPHSMDFHAAQVDPKTAFRSVPKGESVSYTFKPRYAGAFMYHCGTAPVLMHIGSGMYGAIIVDPPTPLPPAKEFVLVQGEYYLGPVTNGVALFDYTRMLSESADYFAFNGRPSQYQEAPIRVKRGDRVRFYVLCAGPTNQCAFHIVGEQFETVYLGAPPSSAIHGVQTFSVPAGGGMIFELIADVAGEFPFVNHAFGHGQKGAIGILLVEP